MNIKTWSKKIIPGKFWCCLPVVIFFLFFISCGKPELIVWTTHPELNSLFEQAEKSYKKLKIIFSVPESGDFSSLKPGIFVLDGNQLSAFIEAGLALDLSGRASPLSSSSSLPSSLPSWYKDDRPYAVFLNSGTGVFCYDSELTGQYLYVSDPAAIQEQFSDLNSLIVSAFLVDSRSSGSCAILPSIEELRPAFVSSKSLSLQKAGLSMAEAERWFSDVAEIFADRRWEGLTDEEGNPRRTLAFFLKAHSPFTVPQGSPPGEAWRVIRGPDPESNGGIWLALHRDIFLGRKRTVQRIQGYLNTLLPVLEETAIE